jgi:hypothetical protein
MRSRYASHLGERTSNFKAKLKRPYGVFIQIIDRYTCQPDTRMLMALPLLDCWCSAGTAVCATRDNVTSLMNKGADTRGVLTPTGVFAGTRRCKCSAAQATQSRISAVVR